MGSPPNKVRKNKSQTRHFFALSFLLHLALAFGVFYVSVPFIERSQNDIVSFDFEAHEVAPPQGEQVLPTKGGIDEESVLNEEKLSTPKQSEAPRDLVAEEFEESIKDDFVKPEEPEQQPPAQAAKKPSLAKKWDGSSQGHAQAKGEGAGNTGMVGINNKISGIPTGVRSLEQIRQAPGNPKPQYDLVERRRGDTGVVVFIAYINQKGVPEKFKLAQSTGHRNLDLKALVALKKWRFQPGQEGWVEVPFKWDLRGDLKTEGGLLRRDRRATKQNIAK